MIVTLTLGLIAAIFSLVQLKTHRELHPAQPAVAGGKGPYRRYNATPTRELYERLGATVQALRDAASHKNWMMNWKKVDECQQRGDEALKAKDAKGAIRNQAEAIIETMNQLREQHNRAANETAIDH
jgi:protein phosphatase